MSAADLDDISGATAGGDPTPPTKMRFHISATQLKMFFGCPRKWALMYLAHLPKQENVALADGIVLHEAAADWFRMPAEKWAAKWPQRGEDVRRCKLAVLAGAMVQHAPPSKTARNVEGHDWLEVPELDTAFYFKPDLATDRAIITDWKSTSSTHPQHEWVLQSAAWYMGVPDTGVQLLEDDVQARLYAHAGMTLWRTTSVQCQWVYGCKRFDLGRTPRTWTVEHEFCRAETRDWFWTKLAPAVRIMNRLRAAHEQRMLEPIVVPAIPESCSYTGKFCDALAACLFKESPVPNALARMNLPVLASNPMSKNQNDDGGFAALLSYGTK